MTAKIVSGQDTFQELIQKVINQEVFTERELLDYTIQLIHEGHPCSQPNDEGFPFTLIGYDQATLETFMLKTYALTSLEATLNLADTVPCTVNSRTLQIHLPEGLIYMPD
jgi:hypothetical protein